MRIIFSGASFNDAIHVDPGPDVFVRPSVPLGDLAGDGCCGRRCGSVIGVEKGHCDAIIGRLFELTKLVFGHVGSYRGVDEHQIVVAELFLNGT